MEIAAYPSSTRTWPILSIQAYTAASYIVVIALRAIASVCKFFGQIDCYHYLRYTAKKFHAVHITHTKAHLASPPLAVLTLAKNIARRDVIFREEDVKIAKIMREQFLAEATPHKALDELRDCQIKGATATGICFGATSSVIRDLLHANISSEQELIAFTKQYEEGFDAAASAIQLLYKKTGQLRKSMASTWTAQLAVLQAECDQTHTEKGLQDITERVTAFTQRNEREYNTHINSLSLFIRLKLQDNINSCRKYSLLDKTESQAFDTMPNGLYSLHFSTESGGHAICHLKYSFGSYLFDPNYGLMACKDKTPSEALALLQSKYRQTTLEATAYPYELIP